MDLADSPHLIAVMEHVVAGHTADLTCPFCREDKLEEEGSAWGKRFACPKCEESIEAPPED